MLAEFAECALASRTAVLEFPKRSGRSAAVNPAGSGTNRVDHQPLIIHGALLRVSRQQRLPAAPLRSGHVDADARRHGQSEPLPLRGLPDVVSVASG